MTDTPSETGISSYERKFKRAQVEMEGVGLTKHISIDSDLRRLAVIGFEPRPFLYWESALSNVYLFLFLVVSIGTVNAALRFLLDGRICIPDIVGPAFLAAVPLVALSILLRWYQRKKYKLSRWDDL